MRGGAGEVVYKDKVHGIVHCLFIQMEKQNVKDTDEHSQQLATTKGQLVPEQQKVDELENQLLQRKRVAYLLNKYREGRCC